VESQEGLRPLPFFQRAIHNSATKLRRNRDAILVGQPKSNIPSRVRGWLSVVSQAQRKRRTQSFYESMREVAPGDLIFSFVDTRIAAIGIAKSYCWECPKPTEFGSTGANWENIGVNVSFVSLLNKIRPKDHIEVLKTVLPQRYSPLQANGNGIQSIYLT
jgi:putative restriction endonuclease